MKHGDDTKYDFKKLAFWLQFQHFLYISKKMKVLVLLRTTWPVEFIRDNASVWIGKQPKVQAIVSMQATIQDKVTTYNKRGHVTECMNVCVCVFFVASADLYVCDWNNQNVATSVSPIAYSPYLPSVNSYFYSARRMWICSWETQKTHDCFPRFKVPSIGKQSRNVGGIWPHTLEKRNK